MSAFWNSHGGQIFGLYCLILTAMIFSLIDHNTGISVLNILIGALLRDMQDEKKP